MEKTRKNRKTAAEFIAQPEVITDSLVQGTINWCDRHNVRYPLWVTDRRINPAKRPWNHPKGITHDSSEFLALLVLTDVQLATTYSNEDLWVKAEAEAAELGDATVLQLIQGRSPDAFAEAERVCRQLNPGYRAVMEARENPVEEPEGALQNITASCLTAALLWPVQEMLPL